MAKHSQMEQEDVGYILSLTSPANQVQADGKAIESATATLALGDFLQPKQSITFEVIKGSAKFSNGKQSIEQSTNVAGRASVTFSDTDTKSGQIVARMTNLTSVQSDTVPYQFTAADTDDYRFDLQVAVNNAPADGTWANTALVGLLQGDQHLGVSRKSITLQITKGSAQFDNGTQQIELMTDSGGYASANFSDTVAETGTLTARVTDSPTIKSDPVLYQFHIYSFILSIESNDALADGVSPNKASITLLRESQPQSGQSVTFQITKGSAKFSNGTQQIAYSTNAQGKIPDVEFTDGLAESGMIRALLSDPPRVDSNSASYKFDVPYSLVLEVVPNKALGDGKSKNTARATLSQGGQPLISREVIFQINGFSALFSDKTQQIKQLTDKTGIASVDFTDTLAETGTITAATAGRPFGISDTVKFHFVASDNDLYRIDIGVVKNDAPADRISSNRASATLSREGKKLSGQWITFTITKGSARFGNGTQQIDQSTDTTGTASVDFNDVYGETGIITASMANPAYAVSDSTSYHFTVGL